MMFCYGSALEAQHTGTRAAANKSKTNWLLSHTQCVNDMLQPNPAKRHRASHLILRFPPAPALAPPLLSAPAAGDYVEEELQELVSEMVKLLTARHLCLASSTFGTKATSTCCNIIEIQCFVAKFMA
jgi:hypothetical protein